MHRFALRIAFGLGSALLLASSALAQDPPPAVGPASPPPPPPKYEDYGTQEDSPVDWTIFPEYEKKEGLFLRFQGGFAYNSAWQTLGGKDETYRGAGFAFGASVGGFVVNNLALGAEFTNAIIPSPSIKVDGVGKGTDDSVALSNLYFAVNYYFTPVDIFLMGGVGLGTEWAVETWGPAFKFSAGKEFAVGGNWGLGFAVFTEFVTLPNGTDRDGDVRFNSLTFGAAFTVSKW